MSPVFIHTARVHASTGSSVVFVPHPDRMDQGSPPSSIVVPGRIRPMRRRFVAQDRTSEVSAIALVAEAQQIHRLGSPSCASRGPGRRALDFEEMNTPARRSAHTDRPQSRASPHHRILFSGGNEVGQQFVHCELAAMKLHPL